MVASSIPCKLSLCADRAHACAGDSHVSSAIDVACPTTQNVLAIASLHELHGESWPSSSTSTSSFHRNHQYSVTAVTTSTGSIAERYAYTAYGQPTILDASALVLSSSAINNRYTYTGREWDATLGLYHFRARWMSLSAGRFLCRDPIGYADGGNLYDSYLKLTKVDPSGLEIIRFEFNAFISDSRGTWLPEPVTSTFWDREFKTDGRGFGQVGASRLSTKESIESCAIGLGSPGANTTVGLSHMRRRKLFHPCLGIPCGGDWVEFEDTASLDIDDIKGSHSKSPCQSRIRIQASAGYPFVPGSPNIDYEIVFQFAVTAKDTVLIEFKGNHNKFPDYEAIIEKGPTTQVLYSSLSPDNGPSTFNLNSSVSAYLATSVTVPTPACCSKPRGSCGK